MEANCSGSCSRASTVPAGSFANASSVGANTVNGPSPVSVSSRPAALTAATSVLNVPAVDATATMVPGVSGATGSSSSSEQAAPNTAIERTATAVMDFLWNADIGFSSGENAGVTATP